MTTIDVLTLVITALCGLATFLTIKAMPRWGGTLGQGAVVLLFRLARFFRAVAVAADQAVLHYHLAKREEEIEPSCWSSLGQVFPVPGSDVAGAKQ